MLPGKHPEEVLLAKTLAENMTVTAPRRPSQRLEVFIVATMAALLVDIAGIECLKALPYGCDVREVR